MKRLISTLITLALAASSYAQSHKLSREFRSANAAGDVDIIVKYKSDPADAPADARHQRIISRGGVYKSTQHIIRSASYRVNAEQLAELANDPEVEFISPDHPLKALGSGSVLGSGEGTPTSTGGSTSFLGSGTLSSFVSLSS